MLTVLLAVVLSVPPAGWSCRDLPGGRAHQVLEEELLSSEYGIGIGCQDMADELLFGACSPLGLVDQYLVLLPASVEGWACEFRQPAPPAQPCSADSRAAGERSSPSLRIRAETICRGSCRWAGPWFIFRREETTK